MIPDQPRPWGTAQQQTKPDQAFTLALPQLAPASSFALTLADRKQQHKDITNSTAHGSLDICMSTSTEQLAGTAVHQKKSKKSKSGFEFRFQLLYATGDRVERKQAGTCR
jgi:hypothetical protein